MDLKPIEKLRPFQKFCITIGELPVSYLESLTYVELLYWFINFLQEKVIPAVNKNAEAVEELQTLFVQLKNYVDNYFDNLDVQDEIDHKLDKMVEDGTLDNILMNYANINKIYDTLQDVIADTSIVKDMKIKTLGYYEINDGGEGFYIIEENNGQTIDGGSYVLLNNNLVAKLLFYKNINVNQFGAYGDNTHDDTTAFVNALNFTATNKLKLLLLNKTYRINSIDLPNNTYIMGEGWTKSVLSPVNGCNDSLLKITKPRFNFITLRDFAIDGDYANNTCPNGIFIDKSGTGYDDYYAQDTWLHVENLKICNMYGNGIENYKTGRECRFVNLNLSYNNGWGLKHSGGSDNYFEMITCSYNILGGFYCGGSACRYVNCKAFQNGLNDNTEQKLASNGFYIFSGLAQSFVACEAQENLGHGFYFRNTKNGIFTNLIANRNGVLDNLVPEYSQTQDETPISGKDYYTYSDGVYTKVDINSFTPGVIYYEHVLHYAGIYFSGSVQNLIITGECDDFFVASGYGPQTQKCGVIFDGNMYCSIDLEIKDMRTLYELQQDFITTINGHNIIKINGELISDITSGSIRIKNDTPTVYFGATGQRYLIKNNSGVLGISCTGASGTQLGNIMTINARDLTFGISNSKIGFFGAETPKAKQTASADATDLTSAITLVNNLKSILQKYNLIN